MYSHIVKTKKELLFAFIQWIGPVTCESLEKISGWKHQTVSARLTELSAAGRIVVTGTRRVESGRDANLYVARAR